MARFNKQTNMRKGYDLMFPKKSRRAQQALEYLVTYGWAFVVVILTVGAFAYFGILSPQKYIPNRCEFGVQLSCADYIVIADDSDVTNGVVLLKLQNNFGVDIDVLNVTTADGSGTYCIEKSNPQDPFSCEHTGDAAIITIPEGDLSTTLRLQLQGSDYMVADGDKIAIPIKVTFSRTSATETPPEHFLIGEVFMAAQGYSEYAKSAQKALTS